MLRSEPGLLPALPQRGVLAAGPWGLLLTRLQGLRSTSECVGGQGGFMLGGLSGLKVQTSAFRLLEAIKSLTPACPSTLRRQVLVLFYNKTAENGGKFPSNSILM